MKGTTGGMLAVVAAALLWGTTGTAAALAPGVGPLAIGAAAMGVGGLLQALIAVHPIRRSLPTLRRHRILVVLGAVSVAIYPLAFYSSMHLGGVAVGTVISLASAPVASAVLERATAGTPLSRRWLLAVGLGVLGSVLLCSAQAARPSTSAAATIASVVLGLVAGTTYAVYSWASHGLMQHGVPRSASMGTIFGLGGVLLLPVLMITGAPLLDSGRSIAVATYMALVPMFAGYLLFGLGLQRVTPSTATTLTMAEPALAALLAVLVVGERLSPAGWFGLGLIGLCLLVLTVPLPRPRSGAIRTRQLARGGEDPAVELDGEVLQVVVDDLPTATGGQRH